IPLLMQKAFVAAEDDRFYDHPGVDYQGIIRASYHLLRTGQKGQGGSTITMQLTRNFFLGFERTYTRKAREIFLALKVEKELSKDEILRLYLNKIYFGQRAYGVGAAAEVYYGTEPSELTLPQIAMIAGLPKAPSKTNPVRDPERALARRNYVLGRMHELEFIDDETYQEARETPISAQLYRPEVALEAAFVGEFVRAEMVNRFGNEAYTRGLRVYTTIRGELQHSADLALRNALLAYDKRHGYRGAEAHVEPAADADDNSLDAILREYLTFGGQRPALVLEVEARKTTVYIGEGERAELDWDAMAWAQPHVNENQLGPEPKTATQILKPGDIIRVAQDENQKWLLSQVPAVSGALVSLDPQNGAIIAMAGGFDFYHSKFNRVTQALRQPGSSFKPFIYSAALQNDFTPASIINDAPVVFDDSRLEDTWRPENYSGKFYGPTRLREALMKSRNLVSIRVLDTIGTDFAIEHIGKFGFDGKRLPNDLSLALGSGSVSPLELAQGYAVFANGGYRVEPYLIERVETAAGELLSKANPERVCNNRCRSSLSTALLQPEDQGDESELTTLVIDPPPRIAQKVIPTANAYQMVSMMQDVIRAGTGHKATELGRKDIAGKTGTTNDLRDAWFSGYNGDVVATAWVGFDRNTPLGAKEVGGVAALPMWIDYMRVALKDRPPSAMKQPEGMVTVRIDPDSGLLSDPSNENAILETFRADRVPTRRAQRFQQLDGIENEGSDGTQQVLTTGGGGGKVEIPEQLF
ncbi:MAG: penicillin-binding protein 1A, partial [Gammaproteobacteria bacterium]